VTDEALKTNNKLTITSLPHAISWSWIYKIKHHEDGIINWYKTRLMAKGYTQLDGLDFLDNFSLVTKLTKVYLLFYLATINSWHLKQLDVNNSFCMVNFMKNYIYKSPCTNIVASNQVCRLHKSLDEPKQVIMKSYEKLSTFQITSSYSHSSTSHSLFLIFYRLY